MNCDASTQVLSVKAWLPRWMRSMRRTLFTTKKALKPGVGGTLGSIKTGQKPYVNCVKRSMHTKVKLNSYPYYYSSTIHVIKAII